MKNSSTAKKRFPLSAKDIFITGYIFLAAFYLCVVLSLVDEGSSYVSMVFLLAVFLISRLTDGYFYGIAASVAGVFGVNYFFTFPYMQFNFSLPGYPLTFVTMLIVSVATSTITSQLKNGEQVKAEAEREKMRGNLLRSVSHDIRTPLTAIIGSSETLLDNPDIDESKKRELIAGINSDASWLLRMVENLLSITRLESGGASLELRTEIIEEVVGAAVVKFRKWHQNSPLRVEGSNELLMADMDAVLIEQVLLNFLDNAARHSKGATDIELKVERKGDMAAFSVCDNGCGISKEDLPYLFSGTKPGKADSDRSLGIGLSVCRTIIKAHGGRVFAGNRPEGGACFMFMLPLTEVEYEQ